MARLWSPSPATRRALDVQDGRGIVDVPEQVRVVPLVPADDAGAQGERAAAAPPRRWRRASPLFKRAQPASPKQVGVVVGAVPGASASGGAGEEVAAGARAHAREQAQGQKVERVCPRHHRSPKRGPHSKEGPPPVKVRGPLARPAPEASVRYAPQTVPGAGQRPPRSPVDNRTTAGIALACPCAQAKIGLAHPLRSRHAIGPSPRLPAARRRYRCPSRAAATKSQFGIDAARRGLWSEARFRFEKAVTLDPDNADALNNLAVSLEQQGAFERAREAYEKALKIKPDSVYIQQNFDLFREADDKRNRKSKKKT